MHIRNMALFIDRRRMVGSIASTLACASGGNGLQQLVGNTCTEEEGAGFGDYSCSL